jgi:hypothetical protein
MLRKKNANADVSISYEFVLGRLRVPKEFLDLKGKK